MSEAASDLPELTEDERREYEPDMDSLHVLPLNIIPFDLSSLKRAKMIKNVRLETVIEMFRDDSAGSGPGDGTSDGLVLRGRMRRD